MSQSKPVPIPNNAIYVKGCTNLNQLQQLISCHPSRMGFFYNPPGDNQIYHITCERIFNITDITAKSDGDEFNNDADYTFHHNLNEESSYRISCNLISHSLIVQFLNKNIHGIELKQSEESQQEYLTFTNVQRENLEFNLKQYLFNYLASKQINKKPNDVLAYSDISEVDDKVILHPKL